MSSLPAGTSAQTEDLVVVLSARHPARDAGGHPRIGEPHYSLHLSASRLAGAIRHAGHSPIYVARPEIFATDISRAFLAPAGQRMVHVASGDFGSLRLLKGAYNIAYVAWEYEKISARLDPVSRSFWRDQVRILNLFDEVWVGATFVRDTFRRAGVRHTEVVPAPTPLIDAAAVLPLADIVRDAVATCLYIDFSSGENTKQALRLLTAPASFYLEDSATEARKIILSIINPGDPRKNVAATILGFLRVADEFPGALLLIKLVVPSGTALEDAIWDPLRFKFGDYLADGLLKSRQIIFLGEAWDDLRLQSLIAAADFYISTSFAEGLNLPVLEAMAMETAVIAPIHTAMTDYLDEDNCISCASRPVTVDGQMVTGYPIGDVTRYDVVDVDAAAAIRRALLLDDGERRAITQRAAEPVRRGYDTPAVARLIAARLAAAVPSATGADEARNR